MCWWLRVYGTVFHNLFVRFLDNLANVFRGNNMIPCCCCCCCSCCCRCCRKHKQTEFDSELQSEIEEQATAITTTTTSALAPNNGSIAKRSSPNFHDYVIVDDIDADYLEIQRHKIETEPYYRTVDRATAEAILTCREDGACLVRPYKESDIAIRYIVSVSAQQQFFHLFVRQIYNQELYGIGQEKPNERLFHSPSDIIEFHRHHPLLCTNKTTSLSLVLRPIVA